MTKKQSPAIVPAGEFKAKCLKLMDQVAATGEEILITKRGEVVAMLSRPPDPRRKSIFGFADDLVLYVGDIMSPAIDPKEWEPDEEELSFYEGMGAQPLKPPSVARKVKKKPKKRAAKR